MAQIFDSLKALINPEMISKASAFLGEKDSNISSAVSSLIPSFLGSLLVTGDTQHVKNTLEDAGKSNILSDIGGVFSGKMSDEQQNSGNRLTQILMGNRTSDLTSGVASSSGITTASAGKLTTMVSAVVASFLGGKMVNNNMSLSGLLEQLKGEKSSFMGLIPSGLRNKLGLSSLIAGGGGQSNNPKKKKSSGWITWIIVIIVLLLLILWWRSCKNRHTVGNLIDKTTEMVDTAAQRTAAAVENITQKIVPEITLPNGAKLVAYEGGTEQQIITYLNSDEFKNASEDVLRKKWFDFDHLLFKHDSSTELQEGTFDQLNNIVAILNYYKDVRVRVAGFADRTGTRGINMEISQARADHVKSILVQKGVAASRINTQGFGKEYATRSVTAPDSARVHDRHISMRFMR